MSTTDLPSDMSNSAELVAYLDGEMLLDDCRRVEQRLSTDADYRRQLAELDQAWTVLDELPRPVVTDDFARTTIEMVAVAAERDLAERSAALSTRGRYQRLLIAALCGIFAAAGYVAVSMLLPNPNDRLLADLPAIAQVDVLTEIGDIEFLRGLSKAGVERFVRDEEASTATHELDIPAGGWETLDDRRAWIEQLSDEERAELAVKLPRFENRSSDSQRDRVRRLQQEIAAAGDREQLRTTLSAYGQWIKSRTAGQRMELRELATTEERLHKVEELVRQTERFARRRLSTADEKALQEAILDFVDERRQELNREIRRQGNSDLQRQVELRSTAVVALVIIGRELRDDDRRPRLQDTLISRLSAPTQEYIESLPRRQRRWQLWRWCHDALDPRYGPRELETFFVEELNNDQREYLLGLPQVEMEERLEQLYVGSQLGDRGREWLGFEGPGRVGRGEPGPPGPRWNPDAQSEGRGRRDRSFNDGPPPDGPAGRRPPPRDFDDRRPERGRVDGPPNGRRPLGPPPDGPPPDRRGGPPQEPI